MSGRDAWEGTACGDVFDGIDEGLALVDPETVRIVAVNRALVEISGVDREALLGRELSELTNNESRAAVTYATAMVERAVAGEPQSFDWRDRDAAGNRLDLVVRFVPTVVDEDEHLLVVVRDVSAERALRRRTERLEEFAGVVSHDLRGPLNVIQGELGRFYETGDTEHLETVESASAYLDSVVTDLLDLAREGRTIRETESVSIELVARRAWSLVDTRGATLSVTTDLEIEADSERLVRALENLFRNSVEHGSTGSRTQSDDSVGRDGTDRPSRIRTDSVENRNGARGTTARGVRGENAEQGPERPADELEVRVGKLRNGAGFFVADDGTGIPGPVRERVFEPGFSTCEEGTGLGLSIVRRIVEAHGWSVELTESESGGARFVVRGPTPSERVGQ